ncbi:MAG: hypothetical protein ACTH5W_20540 [Providencia sp.]|uniref:hypothetical protein n=1 Tax=Providencia sp. TaxID=589 RepID=UPI003F971776
MMIINFKEKQKNREISTSKNSECEIFTRKNTDNIVCFSGIKKNDSFELAKEKSRQSSLKIKW